MAGTPPPARGTYPERWEYWAEFAQADAEDPEVAGCLRSRWPGWHAPK
jgi:hypothetical protein